MRRQQRRQRATRPTTDSPTIAFRQGVRLCSSVCRPTEEKAGPSPSSRSSAMLAVPACSSSDARARPRRTSPRSGSARRCRCPGPNAPLGKDALQGAQLAADILNKGLPGLKLPLANDKGLPNLNHAKFKIVPADTQGKPENGASAVNHLVNDENVHVLAGALESGVTKTAAQQAERLAVPFVTSISSSPALTQQGLKWFFRTGPDRRHLRAVVLRPARRAEEEEHPGRQDRRAVHEQHVRHGRGEGREEPRRLQRQDRSSRTCRSTRPRPT